MKVLVLGAGVVGVASAWYLAEAGHEVSVIERQPSAAMETSFANGGQISAGHAEPWAKPSVLPKILRWLGREDAPLAFRARLDWAQWMWGLRFVLECLPGRFERNCRALAGLAQYSRDCLRELRETSGLRYDHLSRGILHFATDGHDFEVLARDAESARALGIVRQVKSAPECLALEPALRESEVPVTGGVYAPGDESGDARGFTEELARLAARRGVRFRYDTAIKAIEAEGGRVRAVTIVDEDEEKELRADAYVVALGSYSRLALKPLGVSIPVYPLKGYSITLPLGPEHAAAAPTVSLTDEAHKIVISRLGSRLRAAGTAELAGYDTAVSAVRCAAIARRVMNLFPALRSITTYESWAGLRPATPGNVPIVGGTRLANLFLNTGHGTLGWTLACGSGRALADLVSGRRPQVDFGFAH
ncbi:MAG TPA: D-amino acid dehydrogenase [Burkholderiales bacterium]|nr:D-amino acid dehydrogenase [Burkholderiales bacterium]